MSPQQESRIKIGFVPAHREPFDEEWAVQMRERCLKAFSKIKELDVVVPEEITRNGIVRDDADAEKTIQLFKKEKIDGLVIGTMTFGDEVSALAVASAFSSKPILLFGTKEGPFKPDGGRKSDSFCGTLSVSSGLYRRKIPFLFAGIVFPEEQVFLESIKNFASACFVVKGFVAANVGLVGPRPERFETCIFSEDAIIEKFKQRVIPVSLLGVVDQANALKGDALEIQEIIRHMSEEADMSEINEESLKKMAKLEYVLKRFADERSLSGIGVQCWTAIEEVYGITPCYVMGRLTDQGIMTSCEVDIYGALTMLIQYLASLKTTPPHFIDWTIRHQEKENVFLAWHCGNAPPSLACEECPVMVKPHFMMCDTFGSEKSMGAGEFQLKDGTVTLCRLVEYDGKFRMLITKGEIEKADQILRGSWSWVKVPDLDSLYRIIVEEGFIHHASMIHGDYTRQIADACKFLGIETRIV
ncbi:MAG: L-fucose/L-arabinose isomerase family protein [Candidatus Bathyarchaeota archaeon]|nr:L-fucose/L-arabinose isomerase family protein [Candidatus Bathyarchaeota archaeon]